MSYIISRTIEARGRAITTTVDADTMEEALTMDRVLREHDAEIATWRSLEPTGVTMPATHNE